jgi:hypothetical protein
VEGVYTAQRSSPRRRGALVPLEAVALPTAGVTEVGPFSPDVTSQPINNSPAPYSEERFATANGTYKQMRHTT